MVIPVLSPFHSGCFGLASSELAKGAIAYLFHSEKLTWARIHESVITYDGHISRTGITELELGPSENSYSRAGIRSVIVVLEVSGFHTGCLVTKRYTAHGRRGLFVQLDNQVGSGIIT